MRRVTHDRLSQAIVSAGIDSLKFSHDDDMDILIQMRRLFDKLSDPSDPDSSIYDSF